MSLLRLKSDVGRVVFLLEVLEEKPFSCLLYFLEAACIP